MLKKSLLETNQFLKDPEIRRQIIETVTLSSSAIEGVHAPARKAMQNVAKAKTVFSAAQVSVLSGKPRS